MEIRESAHRHGVDDSDILHAWTNAIRLVEYDYDGDERLLVIGPDRRPTAGNCRRSAVEPTRIIHADALRPKFYDYLK